MSIFNRFRQPPPPPPKKWYQQPAIILTVVSLFILGPVGAVYHGMTETIKEQRESIKELDEKKADEDDIKEMLRQNEKRQEQQRTENEDISKSIRQNQEKIIELDKEQAVIKEKQKVEPRDVVEKTLERDNPVVKKVLPPDLFEKFLMIKEKFKDKYRQYLDKRGYDTEGL